MLPRFVRLFLAGAISALALLQPSGGALSADAQPASIDISSLTSFLATLPPDEKDEQLRDWALYGLKSSYGLASADEEIPIRHHELKKSGARDVSPGRVFSLSRQEWGVLLPKELLKNKPLIGGLIDRKYATVNALPEKIFLFGYTYNASAAALSITAAGSFSAKDCFTTAYGYHAATVGTLADFTRFVPLVDDIVLAQWRPDGLLLGGRKYASGSRRALTLEEIAALYQAYHAPADTLNRTKYEAFLQEKYALALQRDGKLRRALQRGTAKKAEVMAKIRRRYPMAATRREVNVGFSLDPERDYETLAAEVDTLVSRVPGAESGMPASALSSRRRELAAAAAQIRTRRDIRPFLALKRRYQRSANSYEQRFGELLRDSEARNTFQAARYDGNLQGTRTAMVLFYTDLLAKLWALDYDGSTPKGSIKGLRTMQEISVPKLYWDEMVHLSQTRLWFGLRQDGFDLYGDKLLFQPVATRVYAASFDPVAPGKEGLPNYQSSEFLGWWDAHYESVAEYEPYYHKLNEIQKWSALFMVLKEKESHLLDFLLPVPVTRTLDFAAWSRNNATLRSKIAIPFLDNRKHGRSTECLPLLSSRDYQLMGANYVLSGGVSLASRKDILAKLHEHDGPAAPPTGSPQKLPAKGRVPSAAAARTAHQPPVDRDAAPPVRVSNPRTTAITRAERPRAPATTGAAGKAGQRADEGYGTFRAESQPKSIKLTWKKGPSVALADFVATLAARQQANPRANRGEGIFGGLPDIQSVVRIKAGNTYLVRTSAIQEGWIYLSVNPATVAGYPAKASAASPDADIFCAKLVSVAEGQRLVAGKTVIK